jgi:Xaa-Pro aminopeptidase
MCDQTRTFSVGPVRPPFGDAHDAARTIMRRVAAAAAPGVPGSTLYDLALELAADRDELFASSERVSFVAHGFGLEIDEPPFLARGYDDVLEPGMVFALEPKFVFPHEGAVGIENSYAVTEDGTEVLTTAPEELAVL